MKQSASLSLDPKLIEAVDRLAQSQDRSRSRLVERWVREGLARETAPVTQPEQATA
jgi:predicted transcriptional regulator